MAGDFTPNTYFPPGYFPEGYFGTGQVDPNAMFATLTASAALTGALTVSAGVRAIYIKRNGSWTSAVTPRVRHNGAWATPTSVRYRNNGTWEEVWAA